MIGASPWAYYYGIQNFADGKLVVDDQLHEEQVNDAKQQGGMLQQYFEIGDNQWALEKAPGYVFYEIPFQKLGIPRWGNVFLALGMIIVTYLLLKRLRDEKTAMIGSLLMLFTPVSLIMLNNAYMDSFATLAFLVMGGGLYITYHLERRNLSSLKGGLLLFSAFLLISYSVFTRYTNFPVAAVFAVHYFIFRVIDLCKRNWNDWRMEIPAVILGVGLPVAALFIYNYVVFGSPWDYGYHYSKMPVSFAYQYLGEVNNQGQSMFWQIVLDNLKNCPKPLLLGFPLLIIAIPGIIIVFYQKFTHNHPESRWAGLRQELSWDIILILVGWFISVFFLYLMYEFTAEYLNDGSSFIRFARFYLPGLFPIVVICALVISRFRFKLYIPVLILAIIAGSMIYAQYDLDSNSSSGSQSPGGTRNSQPAKGLYQGGPPSGGGKLMPQGTSQSGR